MSRLKRVIVGAAVAVLIAAAASAVRPASAGSLSVAVQAVQTCGGLGRCQGASWHDGFLWLYGDAAPNGVIRQYAVDRPVGGPPTVRYTGLQIDLTIRGLNVINHPTGLTWNGTFGCYLGNTVTATRSGTIYHLDWRRMVADRTLDHAVLNVTADDLAVQGCRPEFVRQGDRWLLATADYGAVRNAVRLYDPARLATAKRTGEPGVLVRQVPCGPYVQQLHWVDDRGLLVMAQNQTEGRRWRLVAAADPWALSDLRDVPPYDALPRSDELEGFSLIDADHAVLVTSSGTDNVTVARVRWPAAATAAVASAGSDRDNHGHVQK